MSSETTIRFADVAGVRTRYFQAGDGPALILVHGLGVSGDIFVRNLPALAERFTVYAPDLLGHGFTDAVDYRGDAPQTRMARHLAAWIDALGIGRFSIAGSSLGGLIAGLVYFDRPDRVERLVIIGSGSAFVPPDSIGANLEAALANVGPAMGAPTLESCRRRMAALFHDPAAAGEEILVAQLTAYALPDRFTAYKATIAGMLATLADPAHQIFARLEAIAVPTLVVVGGNDARATIPTHRAGRERIPGARLLVIDRAGHLPYMEHPEVFNTALGRFLAGETVGE